MEDVPTADHKKNHSSCRTKDVVFTKDETETLCKTFVTSGDCRLCTDEFRDNAEEKASSILKIIA